MGCFACGKRDATYIEEFPPTTESPKRFCTGCADKDRCVPTRRCKFIDQEGVQCRGWYTSGGYCKKHGGTTRGDCPDCRKRGSFTKHAFSLDGLDPAVKLCRDDSRNIPGMASDEPFVVVDAPEVQSSWKRYLTVQCLCNQQMNEEVWKKLQNTFMAHYLPRYTECVVKNGELLFADQVKTEDQVEKRLQEIFDMNKKSFELRENRMLAVLYWCPNKEDATKPVLAGFCFLRAYPDDLEGFLLDLDSTVDERSLEAVLQRSSVFRFAETPTKEEKLAGLEAMRSALISSSGINSNAAGAGNGTEVDFSFMVCTQRAFLKSDEIAYLRDLEPALPLNFVEKVMQRSLGIIPRERKNLLVLFAMRRANYKRERRNLEQASTLFDASETAFQEGDGVVLDAPAMFPTENFEEGDDKEHHGDWVFLLFGYQGMKKRSHKKKKHSQAAEDETQAGANTEGHWIFDDDSIDDFTGILLEATRDIEVPVEAANSSKHEAGLYAQAAHDIQRRQSL